MEDKQKRSVYDVLNEYLAARARYHDYASLRSELMEIIGIDHSHDPRNCVECHARLMQNTLGSQGRGY